MTPIAHVHWKCFCKPINVLTRTACVILQYSQLSRRMFLVSYYIIYSQLICLPWGWEHFHRHWGVNTSDFPHSPAFLLNSPTIHMCSLAQQSDYTRSQALAHKSLGTRLPACILSRGGHSHWHCRHSCDRGQKNFDHRFCCLTAPQTGPWPFDRTEINVLTPWPWP